MKLDLGSPGWPASEYNDAERGIERADPAWAKAAFFFRTGVRCGHGAGDLRARSLAKVRAILDAFKVRFEAGQGLALLQAIELCGEENLPLPTWLAVAYREALHRVVGVTGDATSLDSVFNSGDLPSKGKKAVTARRDWKLGNDIYGAAWSTAQRTPHLMSLDAVIKQALKEGDFGVGLTRAKQLFALIEGNQLQLLGEPIQTLSRFLEKRRKQ